jgi:hypothetical protein
MEIRGPDRRDDPPELSSFIVRGYSHCRTRQYGRRNDGLGPSDDARGVGKKTIASVKAPSHRTAVTIDPLTFAEDV